MRSELESKNEKLISDVARIIDDVVSLEELRTMGAYIMPETRPTWK